MNTMNDMVIVMKDIEKSFGRQKVLEKLNLHVPRGSIYAFLGRNGEGKSTSIRLMMNLLTAEGGTIEVLGRDSRKDTEYIKSRVGYVPEMPHVYDWMTIDELIAFTSSFYHAWDRKRCGDLVRSLDLPRKKKVQELSTGMKAKVGLLLALSHNPELLILDDCTSGLDAIVRREFSEHIVSLVAGGTCTVFFSSHIITELERVADWVGILRDGALSHEVTLEDLKQKTRKIYVSLQEGMPSDILTRHASSIVRAVQEKNELVVITKDWNEAMIGEFRALKSHSFDISDLELEDIFVEYTREKKNGGSAL